MRADRQKVTRGSSEQRTCENCGMPLGRFAPEGVCSRCLLEAGLSGLQTVPVAEGRANKILRVRLKQP
jgi:hypothetical protein